LINKTVNLGNLLLSFSDALDLANSKIAYHQQRTAFISIKLCECLGPNENIGINVFIAALLHDIGALSVEEKTLLHEFEETHTAEHCIRGELLLKRFHLLKDISKIVKYHHHRWDQFDDTVDGPIKLAAQIINLADYIERLIVKDKNILVQTDRIIDTINPLSGDLFNPKLVDYFKRIAMSESFWLDMTSPKIYSQLLHEGPLKNIAIDLVHLETISKLYRDVIDFKSSHTAAHSVGVSACAEIIGRQVGLSDNELLFLKVAGNLHDLGKLVIPNAILDKKSCLSGPEFQIMKSHPYYTYHIISTIKGLEGIAEIAGYHHEKLDGTGYPFHLTAEDLNISSRILMISDIFTAMAEDRPYRSGMIKQDVLRSLADFAEKKHLDKNIVSVVIKNYDMIYDHVINMESSIREFYRARIENLCN
jgi:HD-GYP domain-containing protein (c-di-GMP phosphodiesterase class II)